MPLNRKMIVVSIDDLLFRLVLNHQTNIKLRKANGSTPGFWVGLFCSSFQFFALLVFVLSCLYLLLPQSLDYPFLIIFRDFLTFIEYKVSKIKVHWQHFVMNRIYPQDTKVCPTICTPGFHFLPLGGWLV